MHEIVSFTKDIEFKNMINKITSISLEHTLSSDDDSTIKGDFIVSGSYKMTAASQIENDFSYKIPVDIEVLDKYDLTNLVIDIDDFTYEVVDEDVLRVHIDLLLDKLELKENNEEEASDDDLLDDDLFLEVEDEVPLEVTRKEEETEDREERKEEEEKEEMREEKEEIKEEFQEDITTDREEKEVEDVAQKIGNDFREEQEKLEQVQEEVTLECDESPKAVEYVLEENSETPSLFSSFDNSNETYSTYSVYILREGDSLDSVINKYKTTKEKLEEYNDLSDLKVGMKIVVPSNKNE